MKGCTILLVLSLAACVSCNVLSRESQSNRPEVNGRKLKKWHQVFMWDSSQSWRSHVNSLKQMCTKTSAIDRNSTHIQEVVACCNLGERREQLKCFERIQRRAIDDCCQNDVMGLGSNCCNRPGNQRYNCINRQAPFQNRCYRQFQFNANMESSNSIQNNGVEINENGERILPFYSASEEEEEENNAEQKAFYSKSEEREERNIETDPIESASSEEEDEEEREEIEERRERRQKKRGGENGGERQNRNHQPRNSAVSGHIRPQQPPPQPFYSSSEEMEGEENEGDPKPFYSNDEEAEEEFDSRPPPSHWDTALQATPGDEVKPEFASWLVCDQKLQDDISSVLDSSNSCFNFIHNAHQAVPPSLNTTQLICKQGPKQTGPERAQCNACCKAGAYVGQYYVNPDECPYLQCRKLFLHFYKKHKSCIRHPQICGHLFVECCQRQEYGDGN